MLLRDVRTSVLEGTMLPSPTDVHAALPAVYLHGGAGGRFYGLSLDHLEADVPAGWDTHALSARSLITVNGTRSSIHVYQPSLEHLSGCRYMLQLWRSHEVHLHAFKYESWPTHSGTAGLFGCHGCTNVSVFGG